MEENGALYMHNDIAGYGGATLSRSQLLKMKIKLDFTNYQGFGLNQQDPSNVFWADSGYAIVIKRDQFEIQRYTDKSSGIIATFSNDESNLTSDVWYTVDAGLLSTPLGPGILLKTGDKITSTGRVKKRISSDMFLSGTVRELPVCMLQARIIRNKKITRRFTQKG